jgi:condensin complex subunit 3
MRLKNDESQSDISQTTSSKDKSMRRTKSREEMTADERMEADITDMRCLTLCIGMLERVHGVRFTTQLLNICLTTS